MKAIRSLKYGGDMAMKHCAGYYLGLMLILCFAVDICAPGYVLADSPVVEVRVGVGTDDAEEDSSGQMHLTDAELNLGQFMASSHKVGLRFTNINIPPGATITNAYLQFTTNKWSSSTTNLTIWGEDGDNPSGFSTTFGNIANRIKTSASVDWTIAGITYQAHQTPDLTAVVQEIVSRSGWQANNAMVFVIDGTGSQYGRSYEGQASNYPAPLLHIEYASSAAGDPIAESSDDAYQYNSTVYLYSSNIPIGGTSRVAGYRFQAVNVPQGAIINNAYIEITPYYSTSTVSQVEIRGEAVDDAGAYYNTANYLTTRMANVTQTHVDWILSSAWVADTPVDTPDISDIVQEIVGQSGWVSGNAMAFFISGDNSRYAYTYDGDPGKAARLVIEYGTAPAGDPDPPIITIGEKTLGASCWEGDDASDLSFTMTNSGASALNYSIDISYNIGAEWLSLSPADTSSSLNAGYSQAYTIDLLSAALAPGTYEATIIITDPSATNSPETVTVSMTVLEETPDEMAKCGNVPLYTENITSPAVLVLLDLSYSMKQYVDVLSGNAPQTPDLKDVVQEIVSRPAWVSGNSLAFILENSSSTASYRYARTYDGNTAGSPMLHVAYTKDNEDYEFDVRVISKYDDVQETSTGLDATTGLNYTNISYTSEMLSLGAYYQDGLVSGIRFQNCAIPPGATITSAYIELVPVQTSSGSLTLTIYGENTDNAGMFPLGTTTSAVRDLPKTTNSVDWAMPAWVGATSEKRMDAAKSAISELVEDRAIEWSYGTWAAYSGLDPWQDMGDTSDGDGDGTYTIVHVGVDSHDADHQLSLQTAITTTEYQYSNTPFSPSIEAATKYFSGQKASEGGEVYTPPSCQPKFLIEVTDGYGNIDSTIENINSRTQALAATGVSAIGVGFGLPVDQTEQLYEMVTVANQKGDQYEDDYLFALNPEDNNGDPEPFFAYSKEELVNALQTITESVKGAVFIGSAPAATTSTDLGDVVVVASFDAARWTGDVEAIGKDADTGAWEDVKWSASQNMPATRSVWTIDPDTTSSVVSYTTDRLTGDNWLCKDIGDIINSTPVVVGAPPFFYPYDGYNAFAMDMMFSTQREPMIYVGSNDGMLHAVSLKTGVEKWAFLPKSLHAKIMLAEENSQFDMCADDYCHQYYLDGSPQVADVYDHFGGYSKVWRTILVIGERQGGTSFFAMDVTSGEGFDSNADPARFLWEFSDDDLGETWSEPSIKRVPIYGYTSSTDWAVFFGSGYAVDEDVQDTKEAYLYGLEASTGDPIWKKGFSYIEKIKLSSSAGYLNIDYVFNGFEAGETVTGMTTGATGKVVSATATRIDFEELDGTFQDNEILNGNDGGSARANGSLTITKSSLRDVAASPLVVDLEGDHKADRIYIGNSYGTMFRVENIGRYMNPSKSKLFEFDPYPSSADKHPVRARAAFSYGEEDGEIWVFYGTGRYEDQADKSNSEQQYLFGLKDNATPVSTYSLGDLAILEAQFATAEIDGEDKTFRILSGANGSNNPWALKLYAGQSDWGAPTSGSSGSERVFTRPLVADGIVFFTTFVPDPDVCTGSGDTWLFALDYKSGLAANYPVFDLNGDGIFDDGDKLEMNGTTVIPVGIYIGRGKGSRPVLKGDTLFITTSVEQYQNSTTTTNGNKNGLSTPKINRKGNRVRLDSWKQE